jgi:alcohol dehydrogenase class IV
MGRKCQSFRRAVDSRPVIGEGGAVDFFTYDALPARIVFGRGTARTRLADEVGRLEVTRVLLIASSRDAELVRTLVAPFAGRVAATFTDVKEHVPVETAAAVRALAVDIAADAVLCIGGGSTIGAAKAVALTSRIPVLAVPTTYSGSEVTAIWGTTDGGRKTTGVDLAVLPRTVVYDPELTATLPRELAVASGFNAMAHGVEALWAPGRNPVSTVIAAEGVGALADGLRKDDPSELLRGAWLTASAFAVTGSGLHHKLCHVLGGMGLPHARTHAVVLPHVLAFNAPGAPDAAARVARALGVDDAVAGLRDLADDLGVPRGMRDLGMAEDRIDEVAALTEPVVPADNPVPVGGGAMARLVRAAWKGETP